VSKWVWCRGLGVPAGAGVRFPPSAGQVDKAGWLPAVVTVVEVLCFGWGDRGVMTLLVSRGLEVR